ncbi:hypothetical protein EC968_010485 [Mortierella alpina]|nr:hypothetical protein EC968_010485 [Mortierella alpina]
MKRGVRKTLNPSLSAEDQELCEKVALIFTEHGRLWERLENAEKARTSFEKAEKWRYSIDETFDETERIWLQSMAEDADEQNRLRSLAGKLIAEFIDDSLKETAAVTEVVSLSPVLSQINYRRLLETFISSIRHATLQEFGLLEGIAQLIQNAQDGYLQPADLVSILNVLSTRLQGTHQQSSTDLYALVKAVSNVLDAMADCVQGLDREKLHEPLSQYLDGLKSNSDLYLVYHAAYAYQALQYIPDDESPLQSVLRRARVLVSGISGVVSAVKGLDLNQFLSGLEEIHDGLAGAYQVVKAGFKGVAAAVEMIDKGAGLLDSLKEGLSFNQRCAWYPALRGSDVYIQNGQFSKFKQLVCEAPCRRDAAFQLGVCQRLGEVAANSLWDNNTRQQAIDFLCELYKNDAEWGKEASSKKWILTVIVRLTTMPNMQIKEYASAQLKNLEKSGESGRQELYREHLTEAPSLFPLEAAPQSPLTSPLLTRVQNIPDVEEDLHKLRRRQLQDRSKAVYILPRAKANRQASDSDAFDLMENMNVFLKSSAQVFLLLGDSGAGKSTFSRELECVLWIKYSSNGDDIPLFIHLPSIDNPEKDLVAKHLHRCDFLEPQIRELKRNHRFTLICDGYDECQRIYNLYASNKLNEEGQWQAKMVISCRSERLGHDYKGRFQPSVNITAVPGDEGNQLQEAVIVPFSEGQIHDYIHRHIADVKPQWSSKSYITALESIPNLKDLIKNPFLLKLSLDVLPGLVDVDNVEDLSRANITRVGLYDRFIEHWLERGKMRVGSQDLSRRGRAAFDSLVDDGFTINGTEFLTRLAAAIYKEQAGHPIVEYSRFKDEGTWKTRFFNRDDESRLLREACPLVRTGNQYRFVHKSLLEYCFTRAVFDPQASSPSLSAPNLARRGSVNSIFSFDEQTVLEECDNVTRQAVLETPLGWRSFVDEPSILQFLTERVQQEPSFKQQLLMMIEYSKTDKDGRVAAANAITILVRAGIQFIGADLKGIRIPGADLSFGMFEGAQLQEADLRKTNLHNIWLRQANLSESKMRGVRFGEWPFLQECSNVWCLAYSPNGESLVAGLADHSVVVYDAVSWTKLHTLRGHTDQVCAVAYSPDSDWIASGSKDKTVRLWNSRTGALLFTLNGHTNTIPSVVYSPSGHQIASCSVDKSVQLWNTETGTPELTFIDHHDWVHSVAYSPSGHQIASGGKDCMVRLWNPATGDPGPILTGHTSCVLSVMYSPNGDRIVSGSKDKTVRVWDTLTGSAVLIMTGYSTAVSSVAFSPNGHQIASGSSDMTVRLWDAQTGTAGPILTGHSGPVISVTYSPTGHQIASGSTDQTIRLWDARPGSSSLSKSGHTNRVVCVAWSPSRTQIASAAWDNTVRLWDAQTGAPGPILRGHTGVVQSVAYSPSGHQVASAGDDCTLRLWDAQSGAKRLVLKGHGKSVRSVVYSPTGHQLASASFDKTVRLWDAHTGAEIFILVGHAGGVSSVAYSPNGNQTASGSRDWTVRLWDTQTGEPISVLSGHSGIVTDVTYAPGGHQIVSGSSDETVRIWDVKSGACNSVLRGHTAVIWSVAFSSSGRRIASCSEDGTVRLWDAKLGICLTLLSDVENSINWLAWSEGDGGSYLTTGNDDNTVRMWRVTEEEGKPCFKLQWSSSHGSLNVKDANIQNAHGLNRMQIQLLKQRGTKGEPTSPLSVRAVGEKLVCMAATINELKKVPKKGVLKDGTVEPDVGEAEHEVSEKEFELPKEE